MTDTARVHVTLETIYMDLIEDLVDIFGATRAQVISNIVQRFFTESINDNFISKLKVMKRRKYHPDQSELDVKMKNYLKRSNNIPLNDFISHLKIDNQFVVDNLHKWGEKYKFSLDGGKIVKDK